MGKNFQINRNYLHALIELANRSMVFIPSTCGSEGRLLVKTCNYRGVAGNKQKVYEPCDVVDGASIVLTFTGVGGNELVANLQYESDDFGIDGSNQLYLKSKSSIGDLDIMGMGTVALGQNLVTGERGTLIKMINGTGATSVIGSIVSCSGTTDMEFILQGNEFDSIGVVAEAVNDGEEAWIWSSGSNCRVLLKDGESSTRGYLALATDTDGRMENVAIPSANPIQAEHFKEIGHVMESKSSGTDILTMVHLHFN